MMRNERIVQEELLKKVGTLDIPCPDMPLYEYGESGCMRDGDECIRCNKLALADWEAEHGKVVLQRAR
jgi:hypothetical protein